MAKTTAKQDDDNLITITTELIPVDTEKKSLETISPLESQLIALKTEAQSIVINDKMSLDRALDLVVRINRFEKGADKVRLEYTKPARDLLASLKSKVDAWIADASIVRIEIQNKINAEEIKIQKEAEEKRLARVKLLQDSGWVILDGFYVCGPHRIMFDQLETADNNLLNLWVEQGRQEAELKAKRLAEENARLAQIEAREAALKQSEAEMQEFLAWKASKNAEPAVSAVNTPSAEWNLPTEFAPTIQPPFTPIAQTSPEFIPTPVFIVENVSVPESEEDFINIISYNQGIDAVIAHFNNTENKYTKPQWSELWEELKK
jgi:hypothetical protein